MSTLILDRQDLHVELHADRVRLRGGDGDPPRDVPIRLLERVLVVSRTRLDSGVLTALAEAGVSTVILGARRPHRVAMVYGRPHNDLAVRVAQIEHAADPQWCLQWARGTVGRKLRAQLRLARAIERTRPDLRARVVECLRTLERVRGAVARCSTVDSLRGLEGGASRAAFRLLAASVPAELGFRARRRRPPPDPVNALLSLSYTLVHVEAVRAAYIAGLDPYVGFYHRPSFGRESLASDLIEPLRPKVERWVWRALAERLVTASHFRQDRGACLLAKAGREQFYPRFEVFMRPLRRALRRTTLHVAAALRGRVQLRIVDEDGDEGREY